MTTASATAPAPRAGSIRQRVLLTSLTPAMIVGGLWLFNTAVFQRQADEAGAQELVAQSVESMSQRLSDISLVTGNDLQDSQMKVSFGQLSRELGRDDVPLQAVAATNMKGELVAFYRVRDTSAPKSAEAGAEEEAEEQFLTPEMMDQSLTALQRDAATEATAYTRAVAALIKNEEGGQKGSQVFDSGNQLLVAVPAPEAGAYLVGQVDQSYITDKVQDGINRSLLAIVPAMLASLLLGSWLANSIIGRLRRLSDSVSRAANGDNEVRIPIEGNDEVTALARDAERLHAGYLNMVAMNEEL